MVGNSLEEVKISALPVAKLNYVLMHRCSADVGRSIGNAGQRCTAPPAQRFHGEEKRETHVGRKSGRGVQDDVRE